MRRVNSIDEQQWFWCMRFFWRIKTKKKTIIKQGSWWVVRQFCTRTIQPLARRTKKTTFFSAKAFLKKSKTINIAFWKKVGKKKVNLAAYSSVEHNAKKHQIVFTHKQTKKKNDKQQIRSASHHQRWAKVASQQAPDAAGDQSKKTKKDWGGGVLPIKFIQKKGGGRRGMQTGVPVHMKTEKHKHEVEKRERRQRVNDPSKCAVLRANNIHVRTTHIWASAYSETDCTRARGGTMSENERREEERLDDREKETEDGGCKCHSSKKETNFWQKNKKKLNKK